jgi:Flp pilus assembly protein TadG
MKTLLALHRRLRGTRGGAALELALSFPILLTMIGGAADFGLYIWSHGRLSDAVAYGAQYALLAVEGGAASANTNIASAVTKVASAELSGAKVTVTGPACYCLTGSNPPSMTASICTSVCVSNAELPGQYVMINANYTYSPIFPVIGRYMNQTMYSNITVRVK